MSAPTLTVPPPKDDDHEDVAWALRAASAQWRRDAVHDAVSWVQRASETASEVGEEGRSLELAQLAAHLSASGRSVAPAPPQVSVPPRIPPGPSSAPAAIEAEEVEIDFDLEDEEIEMLDMDDDVEIVEDVEPIDDEVEDVEPIDDEVEEVENIDDELEFEEEEMGPPARPLEARSTGPTSTASGLPPRPSAPPRPSKQPRPSASRLPPRPSTQSRLDRLPPSMRPTPSGLDLDVEEESENAEYGELQFEEEITTSKTSISSAPPPDLGPISLAGAAEVPIDNETAAEYAQLRRHEAQRHDHEAIEKELGVDLSVRMPGGGSSPVAPTPPPHKRGSSVPSDVAELSASFSDSPIPGRASVRPSEPPPGGFGDRITSAEAEPYGMAPSADLPPAEARRPGKAPIEPPSHPSEAPPPSEMSEPPSELPAVDGRTSDPASATIAAISSPEPDEFEDMFAAISKPPELLAGASPGPSAGDAPPPVSDSGPSEAESGPEEVLIDGIDIFEIEGLQDLPEDTASALARSARVANLQPNEEVSSFGVALVTAGSVQMMPTVADAACTVARKGEVLFTRGTIEESAAVRIVGAEPNSRVATISKKDLDEAMSSCPWVADELAEVANRYIAFAGAVLGPLGDSLDDMFRFMVLDKCSVKERAAGDVVAKAGESMNGMYIVGGGAIEILNDDGSVEQELGMGDFIFPQTVLSAAPASKTVRVGEGGALLLYADRMAAQELLATCPPFIELLAG